MYIVNHLLFRYYLKILDYATHLSCQSPNLSYLLQHNTLSKVTINVIWLKICGVGDVIKGFVFFKYVTLEKLNVMYSEHRSK